MKRTVGILLLATSFLSAHQPPTQYPQPIIIQMPYPMAPMQQQPAHVVNINNDVNTNTQQNSNAKLETNTQQKQTVAQTHPLSNTQAQILPLFDSIKQYLKNHWLFCSITAACTAYGMLLTYLLYARYRIQNQHRWSNWHIHLTLEQLMQQTDAQLKQTLIKDITSYYLNPHNPTDSVWPLTQFLIAVKAEEKALNRYLAVAGCIQKTPFYRIFPALYHDQAREALTRLTFVYHLFASWSADITWEQLHKVG